MKEKELIDAVEKIINSNLDNKTKNIVITVIKEKIFDLQRENERIKRNMEFVSEDNKQSSK